MRSTAIQKWLDDYRQQSDKEVTAGIVTVSESSGRAPRVVAESLDEASGAEDLLAAADEAVKTDAPVLREPDAAAGENEPTSHVVSVPLRMNERAVGAIALELQQDDQRNPQTVLSRLENLTSAFAAALLAEVDQQITLDAARALQFQSTLLSHKRCREAATEFATEFAKAFKLDHVAIGFFDGQYSRVEAVSNFADFEDNAQVFRITSIAMDEAIEQAATVAYPAITDDRPRINVAQAQLAKRHGCVVCSVPIIDDGRAIGAVTIERSGERSFSMQEVAEYEQIMCVVGPILALKRENERPWHWRLKQSVLRAADTLLGPGHALAKWVVFSGALLLVAGSMVSTDYRVGAPARLEGAIQRTLVAPSDGFLEYAHARPGDRVSAGQVLVELAREDLELERRKWKSELAQHENAAPAALARGDRSEFVLSQTLADEARAKLGLVDEQIARASVRSPFDGVVIMGDLSQSLGAPVQRGDTLLTVAPANLFRLILEVDERDIAAIALGQRGQLALGAMPGRKFDFEVKRISPVAEVREGRNYFEVECELKETLAEMRPGLQGVARIHVDPKPIAWILTHRILDWVRIAMWSLGI